ncbi:MAG: hypothetical protein IH587_08290 [Anaerolineae bacterium]|nr:hypothetical protein [Anaerolineae bacterium]
MIARLCDRLDAADQCLSDFDGSSIQTDTCDADNPDTHGTVSYEMLTWSEVYSELRRLTQDLLTHAVAADTQRRAGDPRYRKWLTRLSVDCVEVMRRLEEFTSVDNQQQT